MSVQMDAGPRHIVLRGNIRTAYEDAQKNMMDVPPNSPSYQIEDNLLRVVVCEDLSINIDTTTLQVVEGPSTETCPFGDWIYTLQEACFNTRIWWAQNNPSMYPWQTELLKNTWKYAPGAVITAQDEKSLTLEDPILGTVTITNHSRFKQFSSPGHQRSKLEELFSQKHRSAESFKKIKFR